ncbi:4'-phosphopantetheinyl transferase family protein [Priestia megaterium]|uniref:4'-phosphopantetheinyl transferase family protein n=1 Tax=Priestia megaterium TaxID=1404 RepID=UPI0018678B68|nr:4'-phosphopantetheinyl transferase superfamily protein [Priestia megaterium]MBE2975819.1 4'-phosphopantetheinyl transferase superfamily protein [Priestia megaterium]
MNNLNSIKYINSLNLTLSENEVHIWYADMTKSKKISEEFLSVLSFDEKIKLNHFYFEKDKVIFVASRSILRMLLGFYTGLNPREIRLSYGPYGKPFLEAGSNINFNISHSNQFILLAFTKKRMIGADIEYIQKVDVESIMQQFSSPQEYSTFCNLDELHKQKSFFKWWTRKEAYIKATGTGLMQCLKDFDVSITPDTEAKILSIKGCSKKANQWSLKELSIDSSYVSTICVEKPIEKYSSFKWSF